MLRILSYYYFNIFLRDMKIALDKELFLSYYYMYNNNKGETMKTIKNGDKKYLNDSELHAFQVVIEKGKNRRDIFAFNLTLFLGLRVQELCNIKLLDIDNNEQTITIRGLKSGRVRTYDIPGKLWRRYKAWIKDRAYISTAKDNDYLFPARLYHDCPLTAQAFKKLFKQYANKAELNIDYSIHSLRHSCAMIRVRAGSHPVAVQKWLRHRSLSSTEVYFEAFLGEKDNKVAAAQFENYM